ncbi:MAG TPA: hypothetical protein VHC86_06685 [Opitutaceae bacterium]|nr:hypothetical protein [Opitutaceae bacterium]
MVAHLVPLVGNALFARSIVSIYRIPPLTFGALAVLGAEYGLFAAAELWLSRSPRWTRLGPLQKMLGAAGRRYRQSRLLFLLAAAGFSVAAAASGLNGYRYSSVGLSETSSPAVLVAVVLNSLLLADAFYVIFVRPVEAAATDKTRLEDLLLAACLLLEANGSFNAVQAVVVAAFAISPRRSRALLSARILPQSGRQWARLAALTVIGFVLLILAWAAGETVKSKRADESFPEAARRLEHLIAAGEEFPGNPASFLAERLSIYHYSFLYTLRHQGDLIEPHRTEALELPFHTLLFRFDHLLGRPYAISRPPVGSLMQFNYQLMAQYPVDSRQGSSPGILAVSNYLFPPPLNIVGAVVYLLGAARVIDRLLSRRSAPALSPLGAFWALLFLTIFFQSPLDLFSLFDNATIYLALILLIGLSLPGRNRGPSLAVTWG